MSVIVQCPKCNASVSVSPEQAGQRVTCPTCQQTFIAPASLGAAKSSDEDDDWLKLDDDLALAPPAKPADTSVGNQANAVAHQGEQGETPSDSVEIDDEFVLPPLESATRAGSADADPFADLPPIGGESDGGQMDESESPEPVHADAAADLWDGTPSNASPESTEAQPAKSLGEDDTFRVTCPICGTVTYARVKQVGKLIKCGDCYSEIKVPPPKPKAKVRMTADAETFTLSEPETSARGIDPFKRSADELLREAEREDDSDDDHYESPLDLSTTVGWVQSVLGIFLDPGVILHFVGLSLLLATPTALTVAYPVFAIGVVPLALLGVSLTVSCAFAIMIGVSNQHETIEDWPTADPAGWFESLFLVIIATAIAVGPPYVFAKLLAAPPLMMVGVVMFFVYLAFPVIVLSMLDMQSVTSPFSPDVVKSITRRQQDWGVFYLSAAVLFAALYAYFLMCSLSPLAIGFGVVLSIATTFLYFALLGRLAFAIGEVVEISALDQEDQEQQEGQPG